MGFTKISPEVEEVQRERAGAKKPVLPPTPEQLATKEKKQKLKADKLCFVTHGDTEIGEDWQEVKDWKEIRAGKDPIHKNTAGKSASFAG